MSTYETGHAGSMAPGTGMTAPGDGAHIHRRIAWGALFGGVILTVAIQLLLSLLGAGVGLSTVDVNAGSTPSGGSFGIGAGLWWVVSSCIALFLGGYASAWMAGIANRFDGILHGLITWGIATLLTVYLLSSAVSGIVGGSASAIGSVASAAGGGIAGAAKPLAQAAGISPDVIQQQAQAYLQPTTATNPATMSPQDAQKTIAADLVTYGKGGPDAAAAKAEIIDITAAQTKMSREEATKRFDDTQAKIQQTLDQTKQKAKDVADATAKNASRGAFGAFVVSLLGLIAAAIGGALAVQRRTRFAPGTESLRARPV